MSVGATADDLVAYRDELPGLASLVTLRGGPGVTLSEATEQSGLSEEKLNRLTRAAGFAVPEPEDRAFSKDFVHLVSTVAAAEAVFGEEAVVQLVRVIGSAMARIADASVSAFLVNVEPAARSEDAPGLAVARANVEASSLVSMLGPALDVLLRQHIIAARRTILGDVADSGYETRRSCVGFVDLVDSTALAQRLSTRELGALLTEFENIAYDLVISNGGRVVKLIGDEVLYTADGADSAATIAVELVRAFADHPVIPEVRAGIAAGDVMRRDGDVFGPVVSLAARAVKLAQPSEIVTPPELARAAGMPAEPLGEHALKGFDEGVELSRLIWRR